MKKYAILCVDDELAVLESLLLTLKKKYAVTVARSGGEALRLLRDLPETAVIVSDMRMPEMDGVSFLAASRKLVPTARRILLTGDRDPSAAIAAINVAGIFRFLSKPCPTQQIVQAVAAAVTDYESEMHDRSAIRKNAVREALRQDPVTRLESRDSFLEYCNAYTDRTNQDHPEASLILLFDIDSLRDISDREDSEAKRHGLVVLATRLRDQLPQAACLGRYEPNVFAAHIAFADQTDVAVGILAKTVIEALENPMIFNGARFQYRIKAGIARTLPGTQIHAALDHAELALADAKAQSRMSYSIYSTELGHRFEHKKRLTQALKEAVVQDQLSLHYQPIVDVSVGSVYSLEALARWEHPTLGRVPPDTFIPLAERLGLMSAMTEWSLARAATDTRLTLASIAGRISVNVSVAQVMHVNFMRSLLTVLETSGLPGSALELEVTESVFADDIKTVCQILTSVRELGIRISVDDFGTGYSSLAYLSQLPVDALKVDRSFVRDFDRGGDAIIGAALDMASKLRLDVIIEGVENASLLGRVCRLGATKIQGYLFARPMPAIDIAGWHASYLKLETPSLVQLTANDLVR